MSRFEPPAWRDGPMRLFHGTTSRHVDAVLSGIDLSVGWPRCDFGPGFYTTTWLLQAWEWARRVADEERLADATVRPAIAYFEVERNDLSPLDVLFFVRAHPDAEAYWSLVWHGRERRGAHRTGDGSRWYDIVAGPVSKVYHSRQSYADYDQVSFHTTRAVRVLDGSPKGDGTWMITG